MEATSFNQKIVGNYLRNNLGLNVKNYVEQYDCFYCTLEGYDFYIPWDKAVEAYMNKVNEILGLK